MAFAPSLLLTPIGRYTTEVVAVVLTSTGDGSGGGSTAAADMASTVTSTNNLSLRSILEKDKLTGSNFLDWERNLMIVLRHERKWYVLEEPLGEAPPANAPAAARNAHKKHSDDLLDVACLMLATMIPDLQTGLINTNAYDMIRQLRDMFQTQARTERYDATKAFNECKMVRGTSVSDHVMKMKRHLDHLERLGHPVPLQLATDTILNSLSEDYRPFVVNYNMNNMEKTIAELHSMLKTAELNMGNKNKTKDVLMVKDGGVKKKNGQASTSKGKGPVQAIQSAPKKGKGKGKGKKVKPNKARTENRCFICNEIGHWRQNCPKRHEAGRNHSSTQQLRKVAVLHIQELEVSPGSYDQLLSNSYKCCRLKVAQIFDRVANIGRDPRLRLLLGNSHNLIRGYPRKPNTSPEAVAKYDKHDMLRSAEASMGKTQSAYSTAPVLAIREGGCKKKKVSHPKGKGKAKVVPRNQGLKRKAETSNILPTSDPKEAICFYCQEKGHWKRSCSKYLEVLKVNKAKECGTSGIFMIELHSTSISNSWVLDTGCGTHICSNSQGLKESRTLKHGELNLIMGNRMTAAVTKIGDLELVLSSGLSIKLLDCCYSPEMARNIISFHALYKDAIPCNGVYESVICAGRDNNNLTLNVGSSNSELDKSSLWHHRLGHINKKRIAKLQSDGILESFDLKSDEEYVCGPFRSATRHGERYFVTFTDDFSRYGFIYLMKNKSDTFEVFKGFKNEVENQLGKKIKMLRSNRGGEYLSHEFYDYLRDCGIVSQLSPPRTPQLNGVAERRNRTLLDMVRSMMSRAKLPMSFWGYALETAAHILNLVPTKKVAKTPSEMWTGSRPSLAHIKVWGCEVFVRRETNDKLEPRAEKCLFVGYPYKSFGYIFYKPSENKVFVARRGFFLERELISKEDSGSNIDLEEVQETTNDEPIVDTSPQHEVESPVEETNITPPPLRRTSRVSKVNQAPEYYYRFHITKEGDTLVNDKTFDSADEPSNYKEAMAGPEAAKWKEAMESEIQSMYDNHVWELVDHTPGRKTVGNKWIFKKKTDMDGNVHTFKARLVAKGYTQTQGIDYDETFSPVAKIKSIRILLAIAAFHDYEISQMDVKTAFLNGKLDEDVYMAQPEGFVHAKYPDKVCKLKRSIYGLKQASRSWNLCFHEKVKEFGFSRSEDESCVYVKASGSNVVFLVLYVDDILLIGNNVPMLQDEKIWLGKCFAMKDLGNAAYILGIRIYRDRTKRLIGLSQSTYLDKILKKFNMSESKKGTSEELDRMSRIPYASAIGSIMYAMTCTRPDVSFALSMVSRYQGNPGESHWTAVKNILKYLRRTKDVFLVYGGKDELRVIGYTDASFQTDRDDSRSQSGWVFLLNGGAVTWKSSKQDTVADSTCESEYIAASEAAKEAAWLKNFIVALTKEPKDHGKSKHIERKYHFVRHKVEEKQIVVSRVPTEENPADPFTKALTRPKHEYHTEAIGVRNINIS
ncbi:hypothetical protein OSB04_un000872 [Centaurea solstitialis]|uniref:Polyprotein n=1 Tax=Centaurea solstitialis TaxID=347529 RepID=A0AA38SMS6_9ASTR|nr:hypothetical protein OSB04_un000872 [Centaurea solstitialis]